MSISYRKLTENDLKTFIRMRITQLREEGATEDVDLVPPLMDYYHRHLADGTYVSWLALDGEKIVGTSGMSFVEKTAVLQLPQRAYRPSVQHVHRSGIPAYGHREGTAPAGNGRSPGIRLRMRADYRLRHGRAAVHGLRI